MAILELQPGYALLRIEFWNQRSNKVVDSTLMTVPLSELNSINSVWCSANLGSSDIQIRVQELTRKEMPDGN